MTMETRIYQALRALVADRVYPDFAPAGAGRPYIVYQQVGGVVLSFLDGAVPSARNGRIQVCSWAETRSEASSLITQVESILRSNSDLQVDVLGASVSTSDDETKLRGSRQDFSVWMQSGIP